MRNKSSGFADAMKAGGLVLLLVACLPLAAALLFFGRAALLAAVPLVAIAAAVLWATTPEGPGHEPAARAEGRAS